MDHAATLAAALHAATAPIPAAQPFLAHWPDTTARRPQSPAQLPVCRHLPALTGYLARTLTTAAPHLEWRQTYGAADFGPDFLQGYGWTEIIGLRGPIPSTRLAAGFLLLGPHVTYPPHAHEAAELYLPLSGTALWQRGDAPFRPVPPHEPIHHPSWLPHAMQTTDQPLLALYLWQGGDLAAKSVILP